MAAFDTSRAPAASSVLAGRIGAFIVSTIASVGAWRDARQTRRELSALSDRELDDIGLCRGDIPKVANAPFL